MPSTIQDPVRAIRQNPDYVERRIVSVGITGWGGHFRLDLEADVQTGTPRRSIHIERSKAALTADPFTGNAELALTEKIYPSERDARNAVTSSPFNRPGYIVYTHYRGEGNIIFPTIISATTTPQLIQALRLAVEHERRDAQAVSNTLFEVFITLAGLRYVSRVPTAGGNSAAASEVTALRESAQRLVQQARQTQGRVVVNLGGTGEVSGAINVNPLKDQQVRKIPNLLKTTAERIGEVFQPGSVDRIVSNDMVYGQANWATAARGAFTVLRSGGEISIAPYAAALSQHLQEIVRALQGAGFRNVVIEANRFVRGIKP
jgi:hypothetical protein